MSVLKPVACCMSGCMKEATEVALSKEDGVGGVISLNLCYEHAISMIATFKPYVPPTPIVARRIVCAAVKMARNDRVVLGIRHGDDFMCDEIERMEPEPWHVTEEDIQGFVDSSGVFLNRQEAWKVAEAAGQILKRCGADTLGGGTLFSENLY